MRLVPVVLASLAFLPAVALAQTPALPAPVPYTDQWSGLNLLLTRDRLTQIGNALAQGDPVATQAYNDAVAAADSALAMTPNPIQGALCVPGYYSSQQAIQQQIAGQIRGDGYAALALAWGYALTGNTAYANQSHAFIFAWVGSLTNAVPGSDAGQTFESDALNWLLGETGGDTEIVMDYSFPLFIYAYDILNGFGFISPSDMNSFKLWLAPFIMYHLSEEEFVNNHQNWQVLFLLCCAHATWDQHLFNIAIGYYRDGMHHQQIALDGGLWRELARGEKAATYTLMALEAMVQSAVIADNHGVTDLRDVIADSRPWDGYDQFELDVWCDFGSSGVSSSGGNFVTAFGALRDFIDIGPSDWNNWQGTIQSTAIDGPANPTDWGWLYEVAAYWFPDPSYPLLIQGPYGLNPIRSYTLSYPTLLFRAFGGVQALPSFPPPP